MARTPPTSSPSTSTRSATGSTPNDPFDNQRRREALQPFGFEEGLRRLAQQHLRGAPHEPTAVPLRTLPLSLWCLGPAAGTGARRAPAASEAPHSRVVKYAERDVVPVNAKIRYTTLIHPARRRAHSGFHLWRQGLLHRRRQRELRLRQAGQGGRRDERQPRHSRRQRLLVRLRGSFGDRRRARPEGLHRADRYFDLVGRRRRAAFRAVLTDRGLPPADRVGQDRSPPGEAAGPAAHRQASQRVPLELPVLPAIRLQFERGRKPFFVDAIYHDGQFTYIKASPEETPVLYERREGKANLVNFDYQDGVFVLPKVLENGYLAIGREKLPFALED
ncbi:MAG: hypothetical protein GC160_16225 [Acidobacteria bacterium]|nr:hypothetical protein [Acidobacteriota bacterium]